jgi:hypothetical protein
MARAGRTEPDSVSIWLKLSEEDAARMTQVLARPEFAGWTRAEWCLEMIQTALGYYTRPRPSAAADREGSPADREGAAAAERAAGAEPTGAEPVAAAPEAVTEEPVADEPVADEPVADEPVADEPVADEPERLARADCPHPADARDYQTGTCVACGAILWD